MSAPMQRAAQEFFELSEPWRKPMAEIEAFIASARLNAGLTKDARTKALWEDIARQLQGVIEGADAFTAIARGDVAYWETSDADALQEAADSLCPALARAA